MTAEPGEPIPGLSRALAGRFAAGHALFNTVFLPETGLGPAFNENQCSACHTSPASGGVGGERVLRATALDSLGACNLLVGDGGGNIRRKVTPFAAEVGIVLEQLPAGATQGRFTAPALYGLGLIEAIPQGTLEAMADPDDQDNDGISGRLGRSAEGRPARFGRKAEAESIEAFVVGALHQEMGLTTAARPVDLTQGHAAPNGDPAADPEVDPAAIALLVDYVRLLAPMGRGPAPAEWTDESVRRGEQHFEAVGCDGCHTPNLATGRSDLAPLAEREVALYSDLLLHDMGPELADVCGPGASPSEVRTEPLMGIRYRESLMHDGRVSNLDAAIRLHAGEAQKARLAFEALGERGRAELIAFLKTL